MNDLTLCEIQQFKEFLLSKPYKFTTIARKYNTLKIFFRYLGKFYGIKNIIPRDSWGSKKQVRANQIRAGQSTLRSTINSSDIDVLINYINSSTNTLKYRDVAIFTMLLTTGVRRSTLLSLKWSHVNLYTNELTLIHSKSSTGRIVMLPPPLKSALLDLYSTSSLSDEYVFMSRQSNCLSKSALGELVTKWAYKANIQQNYSFNITPHILRHTFATECIRQNVTPKKSLNILDTQALNHLHTINT